MPIEETSIFRNTSHLGWRPGLSAMILKGKLAEDYPSLVFDMLRGFRGEGFHIISCKNTLCCSKTCHICHTFHLVGKCDFIDYVAMFYHYNLFIVTAAMLYS